jgi:phage I-like protein
MFRFPTFRIIKEDDWIQLLPYGWVSSPQGQFLVDEISMNEIYSFLARQWRIGVDYKNELLANPLAERVGQIGQIDLRGSKGLWGELFLSPKGQKDIDSQTYPYISPVVIVRSQDNRAVGIHSVGLTNEEVNDGLQARISEAGVRLDNGIQMKVNKTLGLSAPVEVSEDSEKEIYRQLGITDEMLQKYGK